MIKEISDKNIQEFSNKIINAIRCTIGFGEKNLHEPTFCGNEWTYVKDCIDSSFVALGKYTGEFERKVSSFTKSKHAIAVVNGTSALHLSLVLAGVRAGDEVIMPTLTFVSTANAISYIGAKPHFVDSEICSLGIDADKLRSYLKKISVIQNGNCINKITGNKIKAIVPMHVFGHPSNLTELLNISEMFNLVMVEDSAEALGSFFDERHVGTFGKLGVLSFNGNKTITTGGGGIILTDDDNLAEAAFHLSKTAKIKHDYEFIHDQIGFNYRMPNLNAALGCAQMEQLPTILHAKRLLYKKYQKEFNKIENVALLKEPLGCKSNYWLQTIVLDEVYSKYRDQIIKNLHHAGVMVSPIWTPINLLAPYKKCPASDLSVSENIFPRIINVPSNAILT